MRHALKFLGGITLGAGLLYLFDKEHGAQRRAKLTQGDWPLAARLAAGTLGGALAWHGTGRHMLPGIPFALLGFGLLGRALANGEITRWQGRDTQSEQSVEGKTVTRTIHISAPIDRVFDFWAHYDETFPHCIAHVKHVTTMGERRARWVLDGPGSADVIWNTIVTRSSPNKELAWETQPGSAAQHTGRVKFIENGDGNTIIRLRLTYNPLAGAFTQSLAGSRGTDAHSLLDEDLNRMKSLLESERMSDSRSPRPVEATERVP